MPTTFGYWNLRGLGQYVRTLLKYVGEDFEEKIYRCGPEVDDKVQITQSLTIMRYLARKYNLEAKTEEEKVRLDLVVDQCSDFKGAMSKLCYNPKFHDLKDDFAKKDLPPNLQLFEDFLGDRPWFVGDYITWVDFYLYEFLVRPGVFWPNCYLHFPKIAAFLERFEALPQIKAYMASEDFMRLKDRFYMPFAGCER